MKLVAAVGVLLLSIGGLVFGQVTAKQGVVASQGLTDERTTFKSPMILEFPISLFDQLRTGPPTAVLRAPVPEVTKYVCNAVSFQNLFLELVRPNKKGEVVLKAQAILKTDQGMDKLVKLTFEVLSKGETVAKKTIRKIDAEEGKTRSKHAEVVIPEAKTDPSETPVLRITMEVKDNT
jgi:hypothetical protein